MNGNQDTMKTSRDDNLLLRDNSNCYSLIRKLSVRRRLKKPTAARKELACSRLRDGGEKSFSEKKKCKKRAGAGKGQGATAPFLIFALLVLIRPHYTIWEPGTGWKRVREVNSNKVVCFLLGRGHSRGLHSRCSLLLRLPGLYPVNEGWI